LMCNIYNIYHAPENKRTTVSLTNSNILFDCLNLNFYVGAAKSGRALRQKSRRQWFSFTFSIFNVAF